MLTPSSEIIQLLSTFAVAMSAPTFAKSLVLLYGAILAIFGAPWARAYLDLRADPAAIF